jgi:hypothetical protein
VATRSCRADVDCEFVVAAAQILDEAVSGDHDLRGPIALKSAHRSFELTVIGLDRIVRGSVASVDRVIGQG